MPVKGVVFDFNGTLFFDTHLHNAAWDTFLERHGMVLNTEEKNLKIHGKNNSEILKGLFEQDLSKSDIQVLSIEKEDIYQEFCLGGSMELAPGAVEFLSFLTREKIPFTIATASDLYNLEFYFDQLKLSRYFDISTIVYSDGTVKSKPDPDIFLKAINLLDIEAGHTLVFEDSLSGIRAAERAGVGKIIIVASSNHDYNEWSHQRIQDFSQVDRSIFKPV